MRRSPSSWWRRHRPAVNDHAPFSHWLVVVGPLLIVIAAAALAATRLTGRARAAVLGISAGGLFGVSSSLTKTFVAQIQHGVPYTAQHWEVYALAVLSIVGIMLTQNGFQSGSLATSLPALEATEPLIAAWIGLAVLHEQLTGHTAFDNAAIGLSIAAMIIAVIVLASEVGARAEIAEHENRSDHTSDPRPITGPGDVQLVGLFGHARNVRRWRAISASNASTYTNFRIM